MKTLLFAVACIALTVVTVPRLSGAQAPVAKAAGATTTISIDNFSFNAKTLTVSAGSDVTWVNRDDVPHKIVSTDKKIVSPVLDTDGRFSYRFTKPGTYEYYCSIHPMMTGTITVR